MTVTPLRFEPLRGRRHPTEPRLLEPLARSRLRLRERRRVDIRPQSRAEQRISVERALLNQPFRDAGRDLHVASLPQTGRFDRATSLPEGVPDGVQAGVVERIVDGDTIWVRMDDEGGPLLAGASHNIRLLEIDTPETVAPGEPVQCWGPEAAEFANTTIPVGSTVYLLADVEDQDRCGRFLRYAWTENGAFFNLEAVRQGHAQAVLFEPNDAYIELMREAEAEAKAGDLGMWGAPCDYDAPAPIAGPLPGTAPPAAGVGGDCEPGYDPCVPRYPPDVNCADVSGPIRVTGSDPHGLDGDGDGIGCEG